MDAKDTYESALNERVMEPLRDAFYQGNKLLSELIEEYQPPHLTRQQQQFFYAAIYRWQIASMIDCGVELGDITEEQADDLIRYLDMAVATVIEAIETHESDR